MSEVHKVKENNPGNPNHGRTLHEGSEASAKAFVEQRFPRGNSVNGDFVAPVHVHTPGGNKLMYLGPESEDPWVEVEEDNA